ncbi:hypothetical protein EFQ99_12810 [Rhizobium vallis]|uniref:Uncharacterized protein n=1 Tax=Rhizobium vallis TaxID=634290 RepID=A0A432PME8_9HYPH|nr:hypothetical protein EFQ99_12810 [Rhizobium vallis]
MDKCGREEQICDIDRDLTGQAVVKPGAGKRTGLQAGSKTAWKPTFRGRKRAAYTRQAPPSS